MIGTKIRSIAVEYGSDRRDNDWYRRNHPEALAAAEERGLAKAFSTRGSDARSAGFDEVMARYTTDPFRGARVRYKLGPGQTCLSLELTAARNALEAAGRTDVDCILCASWLPEDFVAPGNGVFLARALETRAPAFNVETACSSGLAALELAEGLLSVGRYRSVLVVLSNTVSRQADDANTLSWISSDVAAAAVLEATEAPSWILASGMENTSATAGVFLHELRDGGVRMSVGPTGAKPLRDTSGPDLVRRLCHAVLERGDARVDDLDFFGCSTPLAWYAELSRTAIDAPAEIVHDLFPRVANVGLPFPLVHLHHGLREQRLAPGDLALLYTVGSASSAGAMLLRPGACSLGPGLPA